MAVTPNTRLTSLQVMQDAPVIPVIVLGDVATPCPWPAPWWLAASACSK